MCLAEWHAGSQAVRPIDLNHPGPVTVIGDPARLHQVLANLLAHTPLSTPAIVHIGVDGDTAVISVADTGPGLTKEECPRIFERFYRADNTRSSSTGGAGLGLSIVESVVTAHAGQVTVSSSKGQGATFRVTLPL